MTRTKTPKRKARTAVIYTRISVDREDQTSIESQEREARALCALRGWRVAGVEVDKGRSAFKENGGAKRPALDRALRMVRTGAADVLVVWAIDRLGRNTRRLLELIADVRAAGGDFAVVTLPIDTSDPFGEAVLTILGAVAQLESGIKSARVTSWHEHRRGGALPPTGPTPFGYERVDGELVVVESEAAEIRKAADAILDGASIRSISRDWDARAIGTPWGDRERKRWGHRGVKHILVSPTTSGRRDIEGVLVDGNWPAILDVDTADAVRAVLLDPARRDGLTNERRWMLAGFAECTCGGRLASKPHKAGPRYFCVACHRSITAKALDDHVGASLLGAVDQERWEQARRAGRAPAIDTEALGGRLREIASDYAAGRIDREVYDAAKAAQASVIADAAAEAVELPDVDDLQASWIDLLPEQRLLVVAAFIERVVLHPATRGERVEIGWRA